MGACTTVSQARQLIFGRTCSSRLKCEGTYSRTVRSSAPIRPNFVAPQVGQTQGASCTRFSSGRWSGRREQAYGLFEGLVEEASQFVNCARAFRSDSVPPL